MADTELVDNSNPETRAKVAELDERAPRKLTTEEKSADDAVRADLRATLDTLATLIGATTDPPGTTTLRAIKAQTNATINSSPAASVKALADALITVARTQRQQIRTELRDFTADAARP